MNVIRLKCINQVLQIVNSPEISSGNVNYDKVEFSFCESWSGFTKTAIFYRSKDAVYNQILDTSDSCVIPREVLTKKGLLYIGVFGIKDDVTLTSNVIAYRVNEGAITEGFIPSDPTPDIYAQILAEFGDVRSIYEELSGSVEAIANLNDRVGTLENNITVSTDKTLLGSYPGRVKINSIAGASEQISYEGNNLLPYPFVDTRTSINGVTFTDNGDGTLTIKGTSTGTIYYSLYSGDLVEGQYFLNGRNTLGAGLLYAIGSDDVQYKDNGSGVSLPNGYKTITFYINSGVTVDGTLKPMLNSGTSAMDFEPYVGGVPSPNPDYPQSIESVVISKVKTYGRNLVNWAKHTKQNNVSNVKFENNILSYDYNGSYPNIGYNITHLRGKKIRLECKSITNTNASASTYIQLVITRPDGTKKYEQITNGGSLTPQSDATNITLNILAHNTSATLSGTLTITEPMILIYGMSITYEPYSETAIELSEPITLNGIGDIKDEIVKRSGVWGVYRRLPEVTFNGSETWNKTTTLGGSTNYYFLHSTYSGITSNGNALLSNIGVSTSCYSENEGVQIYNKSQVNVYVAKLGNSTVDEFKTWLTENPITVVYEPATPTFEALPTADQVALNSLASFDTVTNLVIDSPIEPETEVEYGITKSGGYTLEGLLKADSNELLIADLTTALLQLSQE